MKIMHKILVLLLLTAGTLSVQAQTKFFSKNAKIYFNATTSTSPEKIEATNEKALAKLDASTGEMEFGVLMKGFNFEKALMGEHFNENYVESDKFPKSTFKGSITNMSAVNLNKDGNYPVKVKGTLTLHGISKDVQADGTLSVKDGKVSTGVSTFKIVLKDFGIEVPSLVKDKVSEQAEIKVDVNYEPAKTSS
jgi:polyisoprenoid-binding protein YceI